MQTIKLIEKLQKTLKDVQKNNYLTDKTAGDINRWFVNQLSLSFKGKDRTNPSFYNHLYETSEGNKIVEIRLSNHFATEANLLDEDGNPKYEDAVSIIIETTNSPDFSNLSPKYSSYYKEIIYTKECFNDENKKKTLIEIIKGLISALKNGNYPTVKQGFVHVYRNEVLTDKKENNSLNCLTNIIQNIMETKKTTKKAAAKKTTAKKTSKKTTKAASSAKKTVSKELSKAAAKLKKTAGKAISTAKKKVKKAATKAIAATKKVLKKKGLAGTKQVLSLALPIKIKKTVNDDGYVITDAEGVEFFFYYDKLEYDGWAAPLPLPNKKNKHHDNEKTA